MSLFSSVVVSDLSDDGRTDTPPRRRRNVKEEDGGPRESAFWPARVYLRRTLTSKVEQMSTGFSQSDCEGGREGRPHWIIWDVLGLDLVRAHARLPFRGDQNISGDVRPNLHGLLKELSCQVGRTVFQPLCHVLSRHFPIVMLAVEQPSRKLQDPLYGDFSL